MAYLKWSWSPWYAYSHVDGGEGDDALLVAWHVSGPRFDATADELRDAGCEHRPEGLLAYMEQLAPKLGAVVLRDADALGPAVDEFLFEVYNAGKIPMPRDLARRFRTLRRLVKRAVNRPRCDQAEDARGFPMWFVWTRELDEINRQYPPPRLPQEIRDLMTARALRAMGVGTETVSPEQEADERRRIAQAYDAWPPV